MARGISDAWPPTPGDDACARFGRIPQEAHPCKAPPQSGLSEATSHTGARLRGMRRRLRALWTLAPRG
eukprot:1350906-Pyramimonas_sp.AAC.1